MTARDTLLWFGIGMPVTCLLLILLDYAGSTNRGRFVPKGAAVEPDHVLRVGIGAPTTTHPASEPDPADDEPEVVHVTRPVPAVHALVASLRPPRPAHKPWAPGDGLRRPIAGGAAPSAATVRKRAWTTYSVIAPTEVYGDRNAQRLERGRPPLRFNARTRTLEPMQIDVDAAGRVRVSWHDADDVVDPYELVRTR